LVDVNVWCLALGPIYMGPSVVADVIDCLVHYCGSNHVFLNLLSKADALSTCRICQVEEIECGLFFLNDDQKRPVRRVS